MTENNSQKKIDDLLKILDNSAIKKENLGDIMQQQFLSNLTEERKKTYFEIYAKFSKLKNEIKGLGGKKYLSQRIEEIRKTGQDILIVSNDDKRITSNIQIMGERQILIINFMKKLDDKLKKELLEIDPYFLEYLASNFYRTFSEISIKLFTDILLVLCGFLEENAEEKKKKHYNHYYKSILENKIMLKDFRSILEDFDKTLKNPIGLKEVVERVFKVNENGGFVLRNNIVHENLFFSQIDKNLLLNEIQEINLFNQAFIQTFYLDELGDMINQKNLDLSKKIFGSNI